MVKDFSKVVKDFRIQSVDHYEFGKNWSETKPGWYECVLPNTASNVSNIKHYLEMLSWIYQNIENCEKHARWYHDFDQLYFKFRYERDYIWFRLTWS